MRARAQEKCEGRYFAKQLEKDKHEWQKLKLNMVFKFIILLLS